LAKGAFRRMKSAWSDGTMDTCMGRRRSAMRRWRMVGRECSGVRGPLVGGGEHHIESSEALGDVLGLDGAVLRFQPLHDEEGGTVPEGAVRVRGGSSGRRQPSPTGRAWRPRCPFFRRHARSRSCCASAMRGLNARTHSQG
jgi:hypothetical protein